MREKREVDLRDEAMNAWGSKELEIDRLCNDVTGKGLPKISNFDTGIGRVGVCKNF
jgi:hypothetical protein